MFARYACPSCEGDLKNTPPELKKQPWYKFVVHRTLSCPHCGAAIVKRFAGFDAALVAGTTLMLSGGGFVSVWGVGRFIIPLVVLLFGLRLLTGLVFSVYVSAGR